ncbi:MAG: hypothetical protein ACFBSE_27105 [Prochloraceae cyanobacterium]
MKIKINIEQSNDGKWSASTKLFNYDISCHEHTREKAISQAQSETFDLLKSQFQESDSHLSNISFNVVNLSSRKPISRLINYFKNKFDRLRHWSIKTMFFYSLTEVLMNTILTNLIILSGFLLLIILLLTFQLLSDRQAIIAAIIPAIALISVNVAQIMIGIFTNKFSKKQEITKKIEPYYEDFINKLSQRKSNKITQQDFIEFIDNFNKAIVNWGSPNVIYQWRKFRKEVCIIVEKSELSHKERWHLRNFLLKIRKEIGHNDNTSVVRYLYECIDDLWNKNNQT